MTATDTHTETHVDDHAVAAAETNDGLYRLVASNDHKMIGRLWIGTSLLFMLAAVVLGVVSNIERVSLDGIDVFGDVPTYFQTWTLFRTAAVFMVIVPMFIGIATVIVPLQVGSASVAFPRLAAAAFWSWFVASAIHIASFIADGGLGPAAGTDTDGTLLTIVSLGLMIVAILAASICIATTIIALRPAGMTLVRVPAFTWSMLVATSVWIFSLPVLIANLIYAYADLQGRPPIAFGNPDRLWSTVDWAWSQPQIYAYAIPVLGILAEIVPVSAKQRQANRPVVLSLIGLFGVLSFGAWAQHAFSRGADPVFEGVGNLIYDEFLYVAFGLVVLLPVLGVLGGVADTIRRGSLPKLGAAFLGAFTGALLLLGAVVSGGLRVIPLWDALHEDNILLSSATAQISFVLGAVIVSAIAALTYWSPKIFGGYAKEPLAMVGVMAVFSGGLMAGVFDMVSAFLGQPDISIAPVSESAVETMNLMVVVALALVAVGVLALIGAMVPAASSDEQLPDDPWDGHTLEWAAPSPPPVGNFVEPIDVVQSPEPLLDEFEEVS